MHTNREQQQLAQENPIAAAAAAAAVSGGPVPQNNAENLLDIDFDGSAPASLQKQPASGASGLEGLAGTPQRVASPAAHAPAGVSNTMDDLMGVFGGDSNGPPAAAAPSNDLINGFASLDMGAGNQPPPPGEQLESQKGAVKKTNEDLLGLF